ncbi:terminase large subunit [uncultured Mediterranean phage uvMED]|nr:terminase large subunit [uncultured Mediterranean phage uvMED]
MPTHIEIPYTPRPLQASLHNKLTKHRWGVIVCHRRFGKTVMAVNHLLREAILCTKPSPRFSYLAPTYRQAKAVAWDYLKQFSSKIPNVKFHETELRADLPNGARINLLGAENPDSLRGIYLDGCILDEVADQPESVFPEIIRPALSDRKGFAYFVGTPRGHNAFFDLYEQAETNKEWFSVVYKASETKIVDTDELEAAQAMMTEDQYNQEFECSWVANVPGSIYGKYLEEAMEDKRITKVPYDHSLKVDTYWDLGIGDSTAIWFAQNDGRAINVIDYYENRNEGLPHYVDVLQRKKYLYGDHIAPHDIEVRELGSGKSRREVAYDLGLDFRVAPKLPLEDGIHAAQMLIPRCWFDSERCKLGLDALRHYHRAYNERTRSFRNSPVHDFSSHAADAFRYLAVGLKERSNWNQPMPRAASGNYNPFTHSGEL